MRRGYAEVGEGGERANLWGDPDLKEVGIFEVNR